ncbi:MAG TPA: MFS transporter [Pirellulales bacterium]|jgi:MFS family permease
MSSSASSLDTPRTWPRSLPFYYGWVNVVFASLAMTATLPGRTHGLGLITEKLLADLELDRVSFAHINLASSLIGAAFCVPTGWLIDRVGVRSVLVLVTAVLGISVIGMSEVSGGASLLVGLILVRGFGQSALSITSIAVIGKWFRRRLGVAMGVFAVLLTFGFIGSVLTMGAAVDAWGWRPAWQSLGLIVLGLATLFWLFVRSTPEGCGLPPDEAPTIELSEVDRCGDFTFRQALWTPAFWVLALGSGAFNLVWSGVTLFNESILAERGFGPNVAVEIMAILTGVGLIANLAAGAVATRTRVVKLLGVGLALLAAALVSFPTIDGLLGVRLYAVAIGLSGGVITVVFFAAWGNLFGRAQLGRIQGAAQLATVLASALGPVVMANGQASTGDYAPVFYALAGVVAMLAVAAFLAPLPRVVQEA